jgi:hypothetical protein
VKQTIVRIADGAELQRHVMPGLVAAGLAEAGCSARLAKGPGGAYLELSDGRAVPVPLDGVGGMPDWVAAPFRILGAEAVYVYVVDIADGLEVLVENPWLGEEVPADPASAGRCRSGPRCMAELRAACVAGRAEEIRRRFLADGRAVPALGEAVAMVERDMAGGLLVNPAALGDEALRLHVAALRAEAAKRGIVAC